MFLRQRDLQGGAGFQENLGQYLFDDTPLDPDCAIPNWRLDCCCGDEEVILISLTCGYLLGFFFLWNSLLMKPMKLVAIFVHEFSHAAACWMTGGQVHAIEVHVNEGGVTKYEGGKRCLVIPAGYLGCSFLGMVFIALSGERTAALIAASLFLLALVISLFFAPNRMMQLLSVGFIVLTTAFILLDRLLFDPLLQYLTLFYGVFIGSFSVYDLYDDLMLALVHPPSHRYLATALRASSSSNKTKPPPLPTTDDPFLLLGLDPRNPTTDVKEIKRAYRKRAMQYHPDVIVGPESSEKERDEASKDFARINAAYEMLSGGGKGNVGAGSSAGGAKTASGGYNYQPPHRRQSSYSSSSYGKSTNWEDFMPDYDEEDAKYDADGDSFGSIFSDILTGAAGYAAGAASSGGGGIVGDLIDFLEGNIDGFESGYDDDKALAQLLLYGSFDEVASEMDETDILVSSLETKLDTVRNELIQVEADLNVAAKFSERLDLEERVAELKAREKVVKGYLKKGKKRLIRLRERYKELMVEGRGGRGYGSSSGSGRETGRSYTGGSASKASPQSSEESTYSSPTSAPAYAEGSSSSKWRNEGFSSSYGRRSSSSRRSRRGRDATADEPASSSAARERPNQQQQRQPSRDAYGSRGSSSARTSSSRTNTPTPQNEPWVPPHRRTQSSAERAAQDKKRLRELKVDDEFDRLKRDMGMSCNHLI
ncbi:hypothetical protein ACHAXT_000615 [Thalassiosira profunda]